MVDHDPPAGSSAAPAAHGMPESPRRPDLLKDAEARIRALTREVGTLREDLRRECKRRERAVAQARQNEEARTSAEAKVNELQYANGKLLAQLQGAKDVAQASSERDRKGMRVLREGLAAVERAVTARAQQGKGLLATALGCVDGLKQQLLEPDPATGSVPLQPTAELQVSVVLAELMRTLGQMQGVLVGSQEDGVAAVAATAMAGMGDQGHGALDVPASLQGLSYSMEKAELHEQVASLKAQVSLLKASADQAVAAAAAATSAASVGREHREAVVSASSELVQLSLELQRSKQERELLSRELEEARHRLVRCEQELQQHQAANRQLQQALHALQHASTDSEQQAGGLQEQLLALRAEKLALEQERAAVGARVLEQQRRLDEQDRRLASMQGAMSEQHQDVRAALELVSHRQSLRGMLLRSGGSGSVSAPGGVPLPSVPSLSTSVAAATAAATAGPLSLSVVPVRSQALTGSCLLPRTGQTSGLEYLPSSERSLASRSVAVRPAGAHTWLPATGDALGAVGSTDISGDASSRTRHSLHSDVGGGLDSFRLDDRKTENEYHRRGAAAVVGAGAAGASAAAGVAMAGGQDLVQPSRPGAWLSRPVHRDGRDVDVWDRDSEGRGLGAPHSRGLAATAESSGALAAHGATTSSTAGSAIGVAAGVAAGGRQALQGGLSGGVSGSQVGEDSREAVARALAAVRAAAAARSATGTPASRSSGLSGSSATLSPGFEPAPTDASAALQRPSAKALAASALQKKVLVSSRGSGVAGCGGGGAAGGGQGLGGVGGYGDTHRQADQLKGDMQDLDQEIAQLEALLKRAASGLA